MHVFSNPSTKDSVRDADSSFFCRHSCTGLQKDRDVAHCHPSSPVDCFNHKCHIRGCHMLFCFRSSCTYMQVHWMKREQMKQLPHGAQREKFACVLRPRKCSVFTPSRARHSLMSVREMSNKKSIHWQRNVHSDFWQFVKSVLIHPIPAIHANLVVLAIDVVPLLRIPPCR